MHFDYFVLQGPAALHCAMLSYCTIHLLTASHHGHVDDQMMGNIPLGQTEEVLHQLEGMTRLLWKQAGVDHDERLISPMLVSQQIVCSMWCACTFTWPHLIHNMHTCTVQSVFSYKGRWAINQDLSKSVEGEGCMNAHMGQAGLQTEVGPQVREYSSFTFFIFLHWLCKNTVI